MNCGDGCAGDSSSLLQHSVDTRRPELHSGKASSQLTEPNGTSMATDFRWIRLPVPRGTGTKTVKGTVTFNSQVQNARAALAGFTFDYSSDDHHINIAQIASYIDAYNINRVTVAAQCQYADKNFDDEYSGNIDLLVIAQVA
jgi:hypothetical protein